jgi:hypothetical protein
VRDPIAVEINNGSAYVRYSEQRVAATLDLDPSCSVAADMAGDDTVIGIELLDVDDEDQMCIARTFAIFHRLEFPNELSATTSPRSI